MEAVTAINVIGTRELAERVARGDPDAESEMYLRYKDGVSIIVEQIVRCGSAAEDVVQESFRIILEKIRRGDLREPDRLSGFISSVARNQAIDHVRRVRRMINQEEIGQAEFLPSSVPDQFERLWQKEQAEIVRQVIDEMKVERDRLVLYRYYILEQDKEDICAELGLSSKQFSSVLFRALKRYKDLYLKRPGGT